MKARHPEFFDYSNRLDFVTKARPAIERLNMSVPWEIFRPLLQKVYIKAEGQAGRPPFDPVVMFKLIILQRLFDLSDEQMEIEIHDRLSFAKFLGFDLGNDVPDRNTIWGFKERLKEKGLVKKLFHKFDHYLEEHGYAARQGHMLDASFVEVPVQRNSRKENSAINEGKVPESWQPNPDDSERKLQHKIHKKSQKDLEARWTQKNSRNHFGFKNHTRGDVDKKMVRDYSVTPASVHDSQAYDDLTKKIDDKKPIFADSAYQSQMTAEKMKASGNTNRICRKGYRNHPLSKEDKKWNRVNVCRIRARIEHIYGAHKQFGGDFIRTIGLARAWVQVGIINLAYNLRRFLYYEYAPTG